MLLRDLHGTTFDSRHIEATTEVLHDPEKGELAKVRLSDGTARLVRVSELELAAREDVSNQFFDGTWPLQPWYG